MRTYTRARVPGATYFFTVNLAERQGNDLLTQHIDALREAFRLARQDHPFVIEAMVVLPDHLHCLWRLPPGDNDFPMRWRLIKARFSRMLPHGERISARRMRKGGRGIWQRGNEGVLLGLHPSLRYYATSSKNETHVSTARLLMKAKSSP